MDYSFPDQPPRKKPRRKLYIWVAILALLIIIVAGFFFWDSSNKATISTNSITPAKPLTDQTFNGHYITFVYHGGYDLKSHQLTSGTETAMLKDDTTYEKLLSVRVEPNGGDKLSISDSGYYLRQSRKDLYHSQQITVAGGSATEFIKNDGSEISVYIPVGSKYADLAFSISGTNDYSGLSDEVSALLQTFHWK